MIKETEIYHGAAFARLIAKSEVPIKLCRYPTKSNASYIINDRVGLYIKYSTHRLSPWRFTFQQAHQGEFAEMKSKLENVFLILVCETDGIAALSYNEVKLILDDNHQTTEWVSVARRRNQRYRVKGSDGSLGFKIADSDFPKKILEALAQNSQP